jgi:O-antigen/teichoic acid export membrane protein
LRLRSSADTLIANLAQQASGIVLFLALPNLLPPAQYAVVVIATVILSFSRFPDLGLSLVYGREIPRLYGIGDQSQVLPWNQTVLWFSTVSGSFVGLLAALFLLANGASLAQTALFAAIPPFTAVVSAYLVFSTARGDFARYRTTQVVLSAGRLLAIPLVGALGLLGWFVAQAAAPLIALANTRLQWIPRPVAIDWGLVRQNLPAGIQLAVISILWFQLLDSARLLAAVHYEADSVATYGLVAAGYQSAYSLVISAFLPVSVRTLTLFGQGESAALEYVGQVIQRSIPLVFVLTIFGAEIAPWFIDLAFPQYAVDSRIPRVMFYSLAAMPVIATVGNILVGMKKNGLYLLILVAALVTAFAVEATLRPWLGLQAAAVAQLAATFALAFMLMAAAHALLRSSNAFRARRWWRPILWLGVLWVVYLVARSVLLTGKP